MAKDIAAKESANAAVYEAPVEPARFDPNLMSWEEATAEADQVIGFDLAKDDLLDALEGVPFLITHLTFRPGVPCTRETGLMAVGELFSYVSVECMIAPEHVLKKRRVDIDKLPFEAGSQVIFNDGSTGIQRQLVGYLHALGYITVADTLTEEGGKGESSYDLPPAKWADVKAGRLQFDPSGDGVYEVNVRLEAPRGLRLSTYENDFAPNGATTRYLG